MFKLQSTFELLLNFNDTTRPIRIEVFSMTDNPKIYRARVWDQNTYDLYPTFLNMPQDNGEQRKMYSSDEVNREITNIVAEDISLITGKEYPNEEAFVEYVNGLVIDYHETFND